MMEPMEEVSSFGTQDVQRCVIVKQDEKGYGLTVSGDNPVRIQSVKDGGAASKAGVHEGDIIIKVNGSLVTNSNHAEVVKLIKAAGSFVALTLLGKQGPPPGPAQQAPYTPQPMDETKKGQITAPTPASEDMTQYYSEERMEMLSRYLESEKQTYIQIQDNYNESPSEKLKKELASMRNRIKLLEQQIATEQQRRSMPTIQEPYSDTLNENVPSNRRGSDQGVRSSHHRQRSSPDTELYSQISPQDINRGSSQVKRNRSDVQDRGGKKGPRRDNAGTRYNGKRTSGAELNRAQTLPGDPEHDEDADDGRLRSSTVGVMDDIGGGKSPMGMNLFNPAPTNATGGMFAPAGNQKGSADIMTMEDDFPSDQEMFDEHGPFDSLEELEKKPAHLAVFLHYLISNKDPSSLFFYLVIESFKAGTPKDMKKWSYEIYSTFIADNSPLKVEMITKENAVSIENDMASTNLPEDRLRNIFGQAQGQAVMEVLDLLSEFRRNRSLGLGSIFGDQLLTQENMERSEEIKTAEQILMPHLDRLMDIKTKREDKNVALAAALSTFMRQIGVKVSGNSSLERCPSFATKEKKGRTRPSKKHVIKGHQFQEKHYTSTAFCSVCDGLLWGIGNQGLCCQDCELNIHKNDVCLERLTFQCTGKPGRKARVSGIRGMIPSKVSKTTSRGRGDDQDRQPVTSPTAGPHQTIVERLEEDNEEIETIKSQGRVHNIISQFRTAESTQHEVFPHSGDEVSLISPGEKGTKVQRSSSLKNDRGPRNHRGRDGERRSKSEYPEQDRSKDDVDMDQNLVAAAISRGDPGSQSSLSEKSQESISSISEVRTYTDDSDMEAEQDTPNWQGKVDKDIVKKLKPKEVKRQEIINELFHTERYHVRNLKVLDKVFYQPLLGETVLPKEIVMQIFPNLPELIEEHSILNARMKKDKRTSQVIQDVGNLLLDRFDGEPGKRMKKVSADFCINQRHCLEMIKSKQRKEAKLNSFITEAEADPLCRRLPLRGVISTQMQRLTKYPLFIQQLLKYTQPKTDENMKLEKALQCCKDLLDHVNQAVREADNRHRLVEIRSKTDLSPYERTTKGNPDEVNTSQIFHKLLYDSPITWKLSRNKTLDMHAMLLEDYIVLLQKQDDKFVLKFHSTSNIQDQSAANNKRHTHSPIIKLSTTLFREVATSKKAFFLISTSGQGPQIYELQAPSSNEKKVWFNLIKSAQENVKRRNSGRGANPMNLPQRPEYHHNLDAKTQDSNSVNTPAERAQRNKVVMKTPEVVTQVPLTAAPAVEEQGDAATLLKKVLEEPVPGDADSRKSTKYILSLLSRVSRLAKEQNVDQLAVEAIEKCHGEVQRVQTLHLQEVRSVEDELSEEQLSVARQAKEIKRLEQELNQQTIGGIPVAAVIGSDAVVTDLDRSDPSAQNRLSYSADSNNSSATDDSDIPEHDYEQVTEIAELRAGNSDDSSENTLQPAHVKPIQAQVATEVVNTQLYDLREAERTGQFVAVASEGVAEGQRASCIQEDRALNLAASQMESMQLSAEGEEGGSANPENPYMTLAEAHSGEVAQYQAWEEQGDRRTSIDTYEKVEDFVPPMAAPVQAETIGAVGFSSTSESLSSYVDEASGGEAVESSRPGKPEAGANPEDEGSLMDEGARLRDESGSTGTGSSSGSSRPNSVVSADSGSEDTKLEQSSATDGKDSEVSDDQAIQVKPTEETLELVDDGAVNPPPLSPEKKGRLKNPLLPSVSLDDPGTDVDNPMLGESLLIVESLSDLTITGEQQEGSGDGASVDLERKETEDEGANKEEPNGEEVEKGAEVVQGQSGSDGKEIGEVTSENGMGVDPVKQEMGDEGVKAEVLQGEGVEKIAKGEQGGTGSDVKDSVDITPGSGIGVDLVKVDIDSKLEVGQTAGLELSRSVSDERERQETGEGADMTSEDDALTEPAKEELGAEEGKPDHTEEREGEMDKITGVEESVSESGETRMQGTEEGERVPRGKESKEDRMEETQQGEGDMTTVEQVQSGSNEAKEQEMRKGSNMASGEAGLVQKEPGSEESIADQIDKNEEVEHGQSGSDGRQETGEDKAITAIDVASQDQVKEDSQNRDDENEGVEKEVGQTDEVEGTYSGSDDGQEGVKGEVLEGMSGDTKTQDVVDNLETGASEVPEQAKEGEKDTQVREGNGMTIPHEGQGDGACGKVEPHLSDEEKGLGDVENRNGEVDNHEEEAGESQGGIGYMTDIESGMTEVGNMEIIEERESDSLKSQPREEDPENLGVSQDQEGPVGSVERETEKMTDVRGEGGEDAAIDSTVEEKGGHSNGMSKVEVMQETDLSLERDVSDSEGDRSITVSETDQVLKVVETDEDQPSSSRQVNDLLILSEGEMDGIPSSQPGIMDTEEYNSDSDDGYEEMV